MAEPTACWLSSPSAVCSERRACVSLHAAFHEVRRAAGHWASLARLGWSFAWTGASHLPFAFQEGCTEFSLTFSSALFWSLFVAQPTMVNTKRGARNKEKTTCTVLSFAMTSAPAGGRSHDEVCKSLGGGGLEESQWRFRRTSSARPVLRRAGRATVLARWQWRCLCCRRSRL